MATAARALAPVATRSTPVWRVRRLMQVARTNPLMASGVLLVALFVFVAVFGTVLAPYSPIDQDITRTRQFPSASHWFGTDELGRDVLSRVIAGARITLIVSISTLALAGGVGVLLGLVTGYWRGRLDRIVMRLVDVQLAIPGLVLALVMVSVMGSGLYTMVIAISVLSYPSFARLTRGVTLRVTEEEYVKAARSLGASTARLLRSHILPNVMPHVLALATVTLGRVVLAIAGLGFLGLGLEPGTPEWGLMVSQARSSFISLPFLVFFPGMAIGIVVLGFNLLGDGLRDFLDPRLRRS